MTPHVLKGEVTMAMNTEQREWLAIRKEAALNIDPETAEVCWEYGLLADPYGLSVDIEDPFVEEVIGDTPDTIRRNFFARSPGSDVWVWVGDLPEATHARLFQRLWQQAGDKKMRRF
jgi:hypothetical protein